MKMPPEIKAQINTRMQRLETLSKPTFRPDLTTTDRLSLFIEVQKEIIIILTRFINAQ